MKAAIVYDNGEVETYGDLERVVKNVEHGELRVTLEVNADADGVEYERLKGYGVKDALIKFFGLKAVMTGQRIAQSAIRKGDLIRMVDHSGPVAGERDYKTLEYVATADGDGDYKFNSGEKFYLLARPKPEWPDRPGSVVLSRENFRPRQTVVWTRGADGMWRGANERGPMTGTIEQIKFNYELVEVVA